MKPVLPLLLSVLFLSACSHTPATPSAPVSPTDTATPALSPAVESATTSATPQTITLEELKKHSTPDNCWLAIDGKVYNVSGFGDGKHPGGKAVYQGCGTDATKLFNTRPMGSGTPHSDKARSFLPNFYIGDLSQ